jgi:hypothetical protein
MLAVWPLVLRRARLARRSLGLVGLLVAAWLVLLGLRVLRIDEGGDTWLLVAGLGWLGAALRFPPFLLLRASSSAWVHSPAPPAEGAGQAPVRQL